MNMNLEELTKTQTILLTVLVSFVTSIATGIVAASLLNEVPGTVGQTVHKVVERTVEKVVPNKENMASAGSATTIKETTVVVRESDMITDSIKNNTKNIVRVFRVSNSNVETNLASSTEETLENKDATFLSLGLLVSEDGLFVAPSGISGALGEYEARFYDGRVFKIQQTNITEDDLILFKILKNNPEQKFNYAKLVKPSILKIGKTIITLSGEERSSAAVGIISKFSYEKAPDLNTGDSLKEEESSENDEKFIERISVIHTDIDSMEVLPGSPLITIFDEVAGIVVGNDNYGSAEYVPSYVTNEMMKKYKEIKKQTEQNTTEESEEG